MTTIVCCSHYHLLQLVSNSLFFLFLDCSTFCCCFHAFSQRKIWFFSLSRQSALFFICIKLTTRVWVQLPKNLKTFFLVMIISSGRISTGIRLYSGGGGGVAEVGGKKGVCFRAEIVHFFEGGRELGWRTRNRDPEMFSIPRLSFNKTAAEMLRE